MSRIRSIFPGQWTDDRFVACSPLARLFVLALRNEADDNGVFEWNPVKLKIRLLPNDACDPSALLQELVDSEHVWRYEVDGRGYGMIRNFQEFQAPRRPVFYHPVPQCELPYGYALSAHFDPLKSKHSRQKRGSTPVSGNTKAHLTNITPDNVRTTAALTEVTPRKEDKELGIKEKKHSRVLPPAFAPELDLAKLLADWNAIADAALLPKATKYTASRIRSASARLRELDWVANYEFALRRVRNSDFCRGGGPRGWRADFDWFLQPDTVTKLLEGKYDNTESTKPRQKDTAELLMERDEREMERIRAESEQARRAADASRRQPGTPTAAADVLAGVLANTGG